MTKAIQIRYYAILREQRGLSDESIATSAKNLRELYGELQGKFNFTLGVDLIRPVVNNTFTDWDFEFKSGDEIVFIPPVAGG